MFYAFQSLLFICFFAFPTKKTGRGANTILVRTDIIHKSIGFNYFTP